MKLIIFIFLLVITTFSSDVPSGKKVLFVYEKVLDVEKNYSEFLKILKDRDYDVSLYPHDDKSIKIEDLLSPTGFQYDQIIFFLSSLKSLRSTKLSQKSITTFIDKGHNVILATDSQSSEAIALIANEFEISFDAPGTFALDHFKNGGSSDLIAAENIPIQGPIFPEKIENPVYFRGVAHRIRKDSHILLPLLTGFDTTLSFRPNEIATKPFISGTQTGLVTALLARNNARVLVSGSLDLFSDEFFQKKNSGNKKFVKQAVEWTFQERGTLKSSNMNHKKVKDDGLDHYIVKDEIEFSIEITEWDGKKSEWKPFQSNDIQVEFTMLDPYIRIPLNQTKSNNGKYFSQFKLPDVYGIFKFEVIFNNLGYGGLGIPSARAPVYPLRHDQYDRFLSSAWPYYASEFSMLVGLFIFSFLFLFNK